MTYFDDRHLLALSWSCGLHALLFFTLAATPSPPRHQRPAALIELAVRQRPPQSGDIRHLSNHQPPLTPPQQRPPTGPIKPSFSQRSDISPKSSKQPPRRPRALHQAPRPPLHITKRLASPRETTRPATTFRSRPRTAQRTPRGDAPSRRISSAPRKVPRLVPSSGNRPLKYPLRARWMRYQGSVKCRLTVDRRGYTKEVRLIQSSGFPELDQAALKHWSQFRFQPTGLIIESTRTLHFKLNL